MQHRSITAHEWQTILAELTHFAQSGSQYAQGALAALARGDSIVYSLNGKATEIRPPAAWLQTQARLTPIARTPALKVVAGSTCSRTGQRRLPGLCQGSMTSLGACNDPACDSHKPPPRAA